MKTTIMLFTLLIAGLSLRAQSLAPALQKNAAYQGAEAKASTYRAIYQLDSNNPDVIKKALRNIRNVLGDPRLKGKLQVELVTFSGGTDAMLKNSPFEKEIVDLIERGVQVSQCSNSLLERSLKKEDMLPFVGYVPSGNGELVIRASEGWVIVKP